MHSQLLRTVAVTLLTLSAFTLAMAQDRALPPLITVTGEAEVGRDALAGRTVAAATRRFRTWSPHVYMPARPPARCGCSVLAGP